MYNPSENNCRDIIPYQDPWSVIMKDNTTNKAQLLTSALIYLQSLSVIDLDFKPDNIMLKPKICDYNTFMSIWSMHTEHEQQLVYSSSKAKQINPEWILENALTEEGFSFVSTRANSKFSRIKAMRSNNCITLSFTNREEGWTHNHGCAVEHPTIHSLNEMKSFLLRTASMNEPEFNHRLEKLVLLIERTLPPESYKRTTSQSHYYHTKNITDMIFKNFGGIALNNYFLIKPDITLPKYYSFLRKATALKDEILTLLSRLTTNHDRTCDDMLKLQAIGKLHDLSTNSAAWQYNQFTNKTHALVRNLLDFVKDEVNPNNRNKSRSF